MSAAHPRGGAMKFVSQRLSTLRARFTAIADRSTTFLHTIMRISVRASDFGIFHLLKGHPRRLPFRICCLSDTVCGRPAEVHC